jgi:DNA helicase-4
MRSNRNGFLFSLRRIRTFKEEQCRHQSDHDQCERQQKCIFHSGGHGAGSGKTLTISGKVKYLIDKKGIKPEEILLISFTRKAAEEMYNRIYKKLNVNVKVKTFHSLGLEIISEYRNKKPDIFDDHKTLLNSYMHNEIYDSSEQVKKLIQFFGYCINIPKDYDEFENLGEYHDHFRNADFETLKGKVNKSGFVAANIRQLSENLQTIQGETVKSLEEFLIANFLFLNGIEYEYERPYEHDTSDQHHRQYKPDFYLSDYEIYIEHFGVNEQMRATWLSPIEEQKYLESMKWKRELHQEHKTVLIESFSFYNKNGELLEKLRLNLLSRGVKFREANYRKIFSSIYPGFPSKHNEALK